MMKFGRPSLPALAGAAAALLVAILIAWRIRGSTSSAHAAVTSAASAAAMAIIEGAGPSTDAAVARLLAAASADTDPLASPAFAPGLGGVLSPYHLACAVGDERTVVTILRSAMSAAAAAASSPASGAGAASRRSAGEAAVRRALDAPTPHVGQTCLSLAAEFGHPGLVSLLIGSGASAAAPARDGTTPLHLAVKYGGADYAAAARGRRRHGSVRQPPLPSDRRIALVSSLARAAGQPPKSGPAHAGVDALARHAGEEGDGREGEEGGASGSPSIDAVISSPSTPLSIAAYRGDRDAVAALLDAGARPTTPGKGGRGGPTPVHFAAAAGEAKALEALLSRTSSTGGGAAAAAAAAGAGAGSGRFTPLHAAAAFGATESPPGVVRVLLKWAGKAGPSAAAALLRAASGDGSTALHFAARGGHSKVAKAIVQQADELIRGGSSDAGGGGGGGGGGGAAELLGMRDLAGRTPFDAACEEREDSNAGAEATALLFHAALFPASAAADDEGSRSGAAAAAAMASCSILSSVAPPAPPTVPQQVAGGSAPVAPAVSAGGGGVPRATSAPPSPPTDEECAQMRIVDAHARPLGGPPPKEMPAGLVRAYTRCGAIPLGDMFVDDSGAGGKGTHYRYGKKHMSGFVTAAETMAKSASPFLAGYQRGGWLAQALRDFAPSVVGSSSVVFGSMQPVVEVAVLAAGGRNVTAVEYNRVTYDHPQIRTVTPAEVAADPGTHRNAYTLALSMSSFDHDGLGRYGDPLSPDADIEAVRKVADDFLVAAGMAGGDGNGGESVTGSGSGSGSARRPVLILSVPVGPDVVVWNLHRRYGRVRLPLLLDADNLEEFGLPAPTAVWETSTGEGVGGGERVRHEPRWHILGAVGWSKEEGPGKLDDASVPWTKSYEPVWVLERRGTGGSGV